MIPKEESFNIRNLNINDDNLQINKMTSARRLAINRAIISNEELQIQNIIKKLIHEEKTVEEYSILIKFLEKTELYEKFKSQKFDESHLTKILYLFAVFSDYEFIEKGKFLFKCGDIANKFYIILNGSVNILKHKEILMRVDAEHYFKILIGYFKNGEKDLLDKTIKANKDIFSVSENDIHRLEEICLRMKIRKLVSLKSSKNEIEKLIKEFSLTPEFNIDIAEIMDIIDESLMDNKPGTNLQKKRVSFIIPNADYLKYRYLDFHDHKMVKIYEYEKFLTLTDGQYFGDYGLEYPNAIRTATIKAEMDTHLLYILAENYNDFILTENLKSRLKEIKYLIECFFFNVVSLSCFQKKYFSNFIFHTFNRNDPLYFEDETIDFIYFIKEGEIELSLNKNIIELQQLIKNLINKSYSKLDNGDAKKEHSNSLINLFKKRRLKGFIYGAKETLGFEEKCLGINRIFEARVYSDKAKIYKIEKSKMDKILDDEKTYSYKNDQSVKIKINSIILRMIDINDLLLNFSDNLVGLNIKFNREIRIKENDDTKKLLKIKDSKSPNIISQKQIDPKYMHSLSNFKNKDLSQLQLNLKEKLLPFKKLSNSNVKHKKQYKTLITMKDLKDELINEKTQIRNIKLNIKKLQENNISKIKNNEMISLNKNGNFINNFNIIQTENSILQNETINSYYESSKISNFVKFKGSFRIEKKKSNKKSKYVNSFDIKNIESNINSCNLYELQNNQVNFLNTTNSPNQKFKNLFVLKKNKHLRSNTTNEI